MLNDDILIAQSSLWANLKLEGKSIKMPSLLGKQDELVEDTTYERMPEYMNIANGVFIRRNRTTSSIIPYRFNITLDTTHTYFIGVMFNETISGLNMYNYDATNSVNTTVSNKITINNFVCGTVTNVQKIDSIHFYTGVTGGIPATAKPLYAIYIDLTNIGLDTLTPQQFYDRYHNLFEKIANGKGIFSLKAPYKCYDINDNKVAEINMWKRVDLSSLSWSYQSANQRWFSNDLTSLIKAPTNDSQMPNMIAEKYQVKPYNDKQEGYLYCSTGGTLFYYSSDGVNAPSGNLYYETATPIELYGINLLANTYENINGRSNVVLGAVDLGTIDFDIIDVAKHTFRGYFQLAKPIDTNVVPNALCSKYTIKSNVDAQSGSYDKSISVGNDNPYVSIIVCDSAYNTAEDLEQAMSGVILIYELATPRTDYYLSRMIPKNVVKIIDDNGIEVEV